MKPVENSISDETTRPPRSSWRPFALAIFCGAFLLFQVQPLIGKFILPRFGGSLGVWTTCVLFFQLVLLAGYAYAHFSSRWFSLRTQAVVHGALLIGALTFLPITPGGQWKAIPGSDPTGRILLLLTSCLGLPYFALAATGPLLQAWVSRLHPGAVPYRLYALSNLSSLLALISYPILFEPMLSRQAQADFWAIGFVGFVLICGWCGWLLWRSNVSVETAGDALAEARPSEESRAETNESPARTPSTATKAMWFALPACGSVLLLGTTNKLCEDVAVIPFLWVLPLGLYLLSFVLCFDNPAWYFRKSFGLLLIPMLALLCAAMLAGADASLSTQIVIYCSMLFVGCVVCHGETHRLRPPPKQLTAFYLLMAAGGASGGIFVTLVAPLVFNSYVELNCAVCLLAMLLALIHAREKSRWHIGKRSLPVWPLAGAGALIFAGVSGLQILSVELDKVFTTRNFYGVLRVSELNKDNLLKQAYQLSHGTTIHGLQFVRAPGAELPTLYFSRDSGIGLIFSSLERRANRHLGFVGLGVGTLAAYGKSGDTFRFYEIDPAIQKLAETRFTYLKNSAARVEVIRGDARISLENEPPQQFDLLVLDAFSSDAIPVHLLTQEAFALYLRHLKPDGAIAVHISNRHLDLFPVVRGIARRFRLGMIPLEWEPPDSHWWLSKSSWALLSFNRELLQFDPLQRAASPAEVTSQKTILWTDDYTSLLSVLKTDKPDGAKSRR